MPRDAPLPARVRRTGDCFLQRDARVADRLYSLTQILLEASSQESADERRRLGWQLRPLRLGPDHRRQRLRHGVAAEHDLSGQHLEQHAAERPHVTAGVHCRPLACSGLMYAAVPRITPVPVIAGDVMVGESSPLVSGCRLQRLRQAEVQHLDHAVGPYFDVRRLQVAVDDALLVRGFERLRYLRGDWERLFERNPSSARRSAIVGPSTSSITSDVMPALFSSP